MNRLLTTTAIALFLGLSPALAVEDSAKQAAEPPEGAGDTSSGSKEQSSVPPSSGDPSNFEAPPSSGAAPSGGASSAPQSSDIKE
jgi:hypothetical protein